ncbi:mitochondrial proton/calcium exchanger protein-like protein [Tanacetum coccineum]
MKRRLNARIEYAKFFEDTVKEMVKEVRNGGSVTNDEILGFAKLFNDQLTLRNISRPRLVNMCKYMGSQPYGTDTYLRYMLHKRLQWIKNDDKMIQSKGGVDARYEDELGEDCRERGMLGLRSVEEMHQQLRDWLDLSLNHSVPSSLLILSRATLFSLPVDTVGVTSLSFGDSVSERQQKLEKEEEEEEAKKKHSVESNKDVVLKAFRYIQNKDIADETVEITHSTSSVQAMAMTALPELSAQGISNIAWALSKIGGEFLYLLEMDRVVKKHSAPRLFTELSKRASDILYTFQPQELIELQWAFAYLYEAMTSEELFASLDRVYQDPYQFTCDNNESL